MCTPGGGWVETVTRFHDAGLPASIPASVRSEISRRGLIIATARAAASAAVSEADIAEATRSVDTAVVQSWLAARGQGAAWDATTASNSTPNNSATSNVRIFYGTSRHRSRNRRRNRNISLGATLTAVTR
jgi:hypothetical protein